MPLSSIQRSRQTQLNGQRHFGKTVEENKSLAQLTTLAADPTDKFDSNVNPSVSQKESTPMLSCQSRLNNKPSQKSFQLVSSKTHSSNHISAAKSTHNSSSRLKHHSAVKAETLTQHLSTIKMQEMRVRRYLDQQHQTAERVEKAQH